MKKRLVINLNTLEETGLSINEFCAIWDIYVKGKLPFNDSNVNYNKLQDKQYIKLITDAKKRVKIVLRDKGKDLIELFLDEKKTSYKKQVKTLNVDILTRLPEFRNKWKGLKPGSMGSLEACKSKLKRWMDENPDYTFDEVLKAAELYIDSLNGDYRYLQRADYFIYKQNNHKEESSNLSAFIDEIDDSPGGDWTSTLN